MKFAFLLALAAASLILPACTAVEIGMVAAEFSDPGAADV